MCIRTQIEAPIADGGTGVKDTSVTGEGVLSKLLELGFCLQHKRSGIAAHGNDLSINHDGGGVKLWCPTGAVQQL